MRIAIYGQNIDKKNIKYISNFFNYIYNKSITVYIEKKFLNILKKFEEFEEFKELNIPTFISYEELSKYIFNIMFIFGGDGTILSAITLIRDLEIPIIGINTGKLGFLSTFNKEIFLKKIDAIFNNKLKTIPRNLLWLEIYEYEYLFPKDFVNFALNEIVISRRETVSMITIDTYINNVFLTSYWADGLIISTSTGSTGYSLSCGGPIITPESSNFVITPVAPHNLFYRSLVVPDNNLIKLKIHSREGNYALSMDTRINIMSINIELNIRKASFYVYFLQEENYNYFQTLQDKLLWGRDIRN